MLLWQVDGVTASPSETGDPGTTGTNHMLHLGNTIQYLFLKGPVSVTDKEENEYLELDPKFDVLKIISFPRYFHKMAQSFENF